MSDGTGSGFSVDGMSSLQSASAASEGEAPKPQRVWLEKNHPGLAGPARQPRRRPRGPARGCGGAPKKQQAPEEGRRSNILGADARGAKQRERAEEQATEAQEVEREALAALSAPSRGG